MRVCLGGTFEFLHCGHQKLLRRAFEIGEYIYIGLTTDKFATRKGRKITPFEARRAGLARFIAEELPPKRWEIAPLEDRFGPTVDGDFQAIAVSPGTEPGAREINRLRRESGFPELEVVVVPWALAQDGQPISSRRIAAGEIDPEGKLLAPAKAPAKSKRAAAACRPDTSAV